MTSDELFAAIPPTLSLEILEFVAATEKPLYKAALEAVAQSRKVRAVFLERQPRAERHQTMLASLGRPPLRLAADNLLRTWLLKKHAGLLADFLDGMKIAHENGVVENLPASAGDADLNNAVEALLAKHPGPVVAVYLHAFSSMNEAGWTNLDALLKSDSRLALKREA